MTSPSSWRNESPWISIRHRESKKVPPNPLKLARLFPSFLLRLFLPPRVNKSNFLWAHTHITKKYSPSPSPSCLPPCPEKCRMSRFDFPASSTRIRMINSNIHLVLVAIVVVVCHRGVGLLARSAHQTNWGVGAAAKESKKSNVFKNHYLRLLSILPLTY